MLPASSDRNGMKASIAVAADLRERIARGDLVVGQALPVESELMVELGVSKGVMREALRILEQQGLVEVRRGVGGGPRVRHPSIAEASVAFGIFLQVAEVPVGDVWRSRDRLVAAAIERLAQDRTDADLHALDEAVTQLTLVVGDFDTYYSQMLDVGETVVELSGSRTDAALVAALRHIMAAELEAATRDVLDVRQQAGLATQAEVAIAASWREVVREIRRRRPRRARRLYERQAALILDAEFRTKLDSETVLDVFGGERGPLLDVPSTAGVNAQNGA
ncbi:MAG: FadR/GntR family transcriptional regulator [Acidimicrobiia bacterium]